ncbi:MAG: response regulator, partial [Deltaproteobacteria bacterium]|nr:response regulator [Deltaproteobacteria bacterium]
MSLGRILAIDDEKNIRLLISNEFSLEGFEVVTAASGEEGLALFQSRKFDVVLLDIKLPKLSGIEILRRMKQISRATEIIMITGYGDIRSAVEAIKLGAGDYVTKPFKLDELLKLVRHLTQKEPIGSKTI